MDTEKDEGNDEEELKKFLATVNWDNVHRRDRMKNEFEWKMNLNQTRNRSKEILDFFEDDDTTVFLSRIAPTMRSVSRSRVSP